MSSPILVTGATGFIGREVVRGLLMSGRPVLALARGRDGQTAEQRVAEAVGVIPDGRLLSVIEGDLTGRGNCLGEAERVDLRETVETVIHCAGDTTLFPDAMESFRAGHIDGPVKMLQWLGSGRLRRWAHLSTAYVCGRRTGTMFEGDGDLGQNFHNPYEQVKLESEVAIRRMGSRLGIDVRAFRPSIVVGAAPKTSGGNPSNLFFHFLRMVAALPDLTNSSEVTLRIEAAPRARFNIVPVEYVAAALVTLAEHSDGARGTFHLVVSDAPTQEAMLAMIAERFGVRGLSLVDCRRARIKNPSPLERLVARMLSTYRDYLEQDVHFDDAGAHRLLDRCGVPPPSLSSQAVGRLIDLAFEGRPAIQRFPLDLRSYA